MDTEVKRGLPETVKLPFEANSHNITPFFKHMSVLNVAQSEEQGKAIYDLREVVELRFAGDRNYSPVMPADAMSHRIGNRVITFAERFSDQYVAFVAGDDQKASGTALEMLQDYGITPAQLSICRALKIYSIEALHALGPDAIKNLGMNANALRKMAAQFMEDRGKRELQKANDGVEALKAEIDRLKALIPAKETPPAEIDAIVQAADKALEDMSDQELKAFIKLKAGRAPTGTPSREWLLSAAKELAA